LIESAIEEILRYNGPIQGTKPGYALEDVTLHGVTIPKGAAVIPLLGAANHDPAVFENPEVFDITRTPNKHLGFGQGIHYCLDAPLARMETRIALKNVFERNPNVRLAIEPEKLKVQNIPLWHRYESLPVMLG
jgi:cytochrome P450